MSFRLAPLTSRACRHAGQYISQPLGRSGVTAADRHSVTVGPAHDDGGPAANQHGFGISMVADDELAGKVNAWIGDAAGYLVKTYRSDIAAVITDTVARWDAEETSRKIELQVGKDLQFIRINGTVVGALAGFAIFAVAHLIFG
jgi:hypothetical protein